MSHLLAQILPSLVYVFIFPGFLFCSLVGCLLAGIDRKLVAKMQKRVGPPITQPLYDFFKLCGKETIIPAAANKWVFLCAPLLGLAGIVVIQLILPVCGFIAFSKIADMIVLLYLLLIPAVAEMIGASASGSPYAGVGLSREMVTVISCEFPLVIIVLTVSKCVGSFSFADIAAYQAANGSLIMNPVMVPAAIAFLLVIPAETGSHPFDAAEAETEICEGMLAEYSGAPLAVYKLTSYIKLFTLTGLFCTLFLGGICTGLIFVDALILVVLCTVITAVCISLVHAVTARLKIEQIFKYYWTIVAGLSLISLVLVWMNL